MAIERAIEAGEVTIDDVFDRDYQLIEGTNPVQYNVRFNDAADRHVRPILDRTKAGDNRIIGSAIGDMNGYLPTHLSERSHPQGPDPVWNDEHCRNRRILIDDTTRMALASDKAGDACDLPDGARRQVHPGEERLRSAVDQGPPLG